MTTMTNEQQIEQKFQEIEATIMEPIDVSRFKPISPQELLQILGLTIKKDEENKIVTFLCELSAYTENSQFNISYNAPSSTGKSFIPTEIAKLFPQEDIMEMAYCSPTAFFHEVGEPDPNRKGHILIDLSRKVMIFLDQPHAQLLERLRPVLSHDKKEVSVKITDKAQKQGMKTKNITMRGYPSVIFCTAGLRIDEQEATRFLLLSPEVNQDKIRQGITEVIRKEADNQKYTDWLNENPERQSLKDRIRAIKEADIEEIKIANEMQIEKRFFEKNKTLKPRHQRDVKRVIAIIKSLALLNLWWRERDGATIIVNTEDIEEGFKIWDKISVSQEYNLPPYVYNLFNEVVMPAWEDKNKDMVSGGLTRQEILYKHYSVYGRPLDGNQLRQQILPMLETTGLITQEQDPNDKRKYLVYPTTPLSISKDQNYSETRGGVTAEVENSNELSGGVAVPDNIADCKR